jgi:hypothetical protein
MSTCAWLGFVDDAGFFTLDHLACDECGAWQNENPREAGDDDGVEYADPRDFRDGLDEVDPW